MYLVIHLFTGRSVMNRNAVEHGYAAGSQQAPHRPEIGGHVCRANMFKHADRHDPVERATLVAVIAQCEIQPVLRLCSATVFRAWES